MIARSIATQRTLLCASKAHRSPFFRPCEVKKRRARRIISNKPLPPCRDADRCVSPPPSSCKRMVSPANSSRAKISSRKLTCKASLCLCVASALAIGLNQTVQPGTHGRQIILPAPLTFARRKLGIPPLHFFLEIHTHARHHFQIPHHCPPDSVGNSLAVLAQLDQRRQQFRF